MVYNKLIYTQEEFYFSFLFFFFLFLTVCEKLYVFFFFLLLNLFSVCFVHWGSSWKYFLFLTFNFSIIRIWNCQWQLSQLPTLERKAKAMGRWTVVDCEKKEN